jgi:hypothetical protein
MRVWILMNDDRADCAEGGSAGTVLKVFADHDEATAALSEARKASADAGLARDAWTDRYMKTYEEAKQRFPSPVNSFLLSQGATDALDAFFKNDPDLSTNIIANYWLLERVLE